MYFWRQNGASKEKLLLRYHIVEDGAGEKITAFRKIRAKQMIPDAYFASMFLFFSFDA